jgi:hypothetical protein
MKSDLENDLLSYFTDVEYLQIVFKEYITSPKLPKRLLVIHGVGGVGKSSLLRMLRLHGKSAHIPIALTSAEESKSAVDVLSNWSSDLKAYDIALSNFQKILVHYKAIQAKVADQAKKAQEARKKAAEKVGTAVAKAIIGAAISLIPGGQIVNVLGGIGVDALVDWLSGFLTKPDIDLLLDPTKALSKGFLEDIAKVARKRRLVLMLDTFEQMTALNDWVCSIAKQLDENILLVIAGRQMVDWDRQWEGWLAYTQVEELEPMTEEHMRMLAHRYYATMVGGQPDPKQTEAIIAFARGLPMVVATAVRLWVKYGHRFAIEEHRAEVYGDVVKRLREGVPSELLSILEAAAIVRWFDRPILRAVTKLKDVNTAYEELRRFPFIKSSQDGLRLHDSIREIIEENLRVDDSERHRDLHLRAEKYFEKKLTKRAIGEEIDQLGLERLYHQIRADETKGMKLFQEIAEELTRYQLVNQLRILVNDSNTYPLERETSQLWREYYSARLAHLEMKFGKAERIYQKIQENRHVEPKLRSYALCDLGTIWSRGEYFWDRGGFDTVTGVISLSQSIYPETDRKLLQNFISMKQSYFHLGNMDGALKSLIRAQEYFSKSADYYGLAIAFDEMKALHARSGNWQAMIAAQRDGFEQIEKIKVSKYSYIRAHLLGWWAIAWVWAGQYKVAEGNLRESMEIKKKLGSKDIIGEVRDLGFALGMQNRFRDAKSLFTYAHKLINDPEKERFLEAMALGFEGKVLMQQGNLVAAKDALQKSFDIKREAGTVGLPEVFNWLGELSELCRDYTAAADFYNQSLNYRSVGRRFFESIALIGLVRVKHAQGDYASLQPLLVEAEQLAQQYEYNDHLASVRLTQGHWAWENRNQDEALALYQKAMVYALRYNRFLLDELLGGRPQGTPLRPIIPFCLERGEDGRKIVIALHDWWKSGNNDIGLPRADTIPPFPKEFR